MACRTAVRILVHYMINGGFLGAGGAANRDNNYILDQIARLRDIPVHVVHGRYDRVCHVYQAEALVRALRDAGNNAVSYCFERLVQPETDREPEKRGSRSRSKSCVVKLD